MNENETRVEASFAPETRFELRPATVAPFRANLETEFERLKNRLLAEQLAAASRTELNAPLRVFPELFAEKAGTAVRQAARQARIYANSRELVCA